MTKIHEAFCADVMYIISDYIRGSEKWMKELHPSRLKIYKELQLGNRPNNTDILMYACRKGYKTIALYIIQCNNVSAENINKALLWAASFGHLEIVQMLINGAGANVHYRNDSALESASASGMTSVVKYLVRCGADIHADSDAAYHSAIRARHILISKYLENVVG